MTYKMELRSTDGASDFTPIAPGWYVRGRDSWQYHPVLGWMCDVMNTWRPCVMVRGDLCLAAGDIVVDDSGNIEGRA